MKSNQWQFLSDLGKQEHARSWWLPSRKRRGSRSLFTGRALSISVQALCAGLILLAALGVAYAGGGGAQFSSQTNPPTQPSTSLNGPGSVFLTANLFGSGGAGTVFVAVADFNGDGKLDYVTANNGNNTTTLGIALGNGDGTFKTPTTIAIPCGALYVATGDFNGDGKTDLAVASADCSPGTNGVEIFLGNGDGTFTAKGTLTSPLSNPFSVAVADFNGDGKLDLTVVDRGASTDAVFFYSGNGDGTFQTPTSVSLGGSVASNQIVVADFNKDGHPDVAVSQINGSNVVVILGNGNGTFQAPRNNALPAQGWGLAVGDFNGDGIPDIVATTPSNGGVTVFLGKGDGNFTSVNNPVSGTLPTANAYVPGGGCTAITLGDFNKDGKLDIATGLSGVNSAALVAVLAGNGDGTFAPERLFGVADTPQSIAVGDFNGDGNLDWIASTGQINSANQGSVTVGLGRGDGTFLATEGYVAGQGPGWAAEADFNKDGKLDVVVPNTPSQSISIFLGKGDGTLQPPTNIAFPALSPSFVVTGDFNNDGNPDFVVFSSWCPNFANAPVFTYLGKGDGTFQSPVSSNISGLSSCGSLNVMVAGDFNGDGKLDIGMLLTTNSGPEIAIMLGNGDGTFQAPVTTPAPGGRATWMSVGDLNKDGKLDAVVVQYMNNEIEVLLGNGDGTFQSPTTLATGRLPGFSVLGDFNGDGKVDIVVDNQQDNNAEIYLGNGDGTFNSPSLINIAPSNSPPSIMMASDFNLDGHLDILFGHNDNRGTGISLLPGNGDGTFQTVQNYLVSGGSSVTAIGDFNGDGAPDALLVDAGEEFVSILLNQTPPPIAVTPSSLSFGNQLVGSTSSALAVKVSNNGATATTVSIAASGDFAQTSNCPVSPATLAPAANCSVSVTFTPTATGVRNGAITVSDPLPGSPQMVALTGTGVAPIVTLGSGSVSFGNQVVGTSSTAQTVSLQNTGTAALIFAGAGITITGTNSGDFSQTNNCGASVAVGASCTINVTFKPTATGARSGSLTINDDAANSPQNVPLSGTGTAPVVGLSSANLTFTSQPVGTTSAAQNITLTNTGNATLTFGGSGIAIAGTNSGDFSQTNTCGARVVAGANCTISVTFTPTATGTRTASVSITDDAGNSPQSVSLTGTGVPAAPMASLSVTSLSFGNQLVGTSSSAQTVTLTNTGNVTLTFSGSGIAITGTNSGDFSQTNTCGASVTAGANCTISVTFKPTATGNRSASVSITDNASGSPQSISLTGTGVAPAVTLSGNSLTFAGQLITTTSSAQSVTITNSGTAPLTISSIAITGANSGDFAQINTCPASNATLAVNANCSISVTFTPSATGTRNASVTITDNASGSPQSVSLTGTGTDFALAAASGANCPSGGNCSTSATISAGSTATYDLQVTPNSGFNGSVALTCSGAPGNSTCTVSPASVPAAGSASYAFSVAVGNTSNVMLVPQTPFRGVPGLPNAFSLIGFPILLFVIWMARPGAKHCYARRLLVPAMAGLLFCVLYSAGCGGGSGGGGPQPPTNAVLKITGASSGVNRTLSLNLTVNH